MPTSPPNSDLNAESFFVSDQLKERFDESCAEKKPRKVDLTANDEAQFSLGDSTYAYDITALSCLLYTSPSPRDKRQSRMPSSA